MSQAKHRRMQPEGEHDSWLHHLLGSSLPAWFRCRTDVSKSDAAAHAAHLSMLLDLTLEEHHLPKHASFCRDDSMDSPKFDASADFRYTTYRKDEIRYSSKGVSRTKRNGWKDALCAADIHVRKRDGQTVLVKEKLRRRKRVVVHGTCS